MAIKNLVLFETMPCADRVASRGSEKLNNCRHQIRFEKIINIGSIIFAAGKNSLLLRFSKSKGVGLELATGSI